MSGNGMRTALRRVLGVAWICALAAGCGSDRVQTPAGSAVVWTRVTSASDVADPAFPDWRAGRILFSYAAAGTRRLAFVREDGTGLSYLPVPSGRDSSARWLTDTTLVESSDRAGSFDLWTRDTTGTSTLHALTVYAGDELEPAPRPGSSGVAYVEASGGSRRLVLLPDTLALPPLRLYLTGPGLVAREPDWDPTGGMVCFSADSAGGSRHIWAVSLTDTLPKQLTTGPYHDDSPRVSPDGTRILFVSDRSSRTGLWTVSPAGEGTSLQIVTYGPPAATISTPAWSPDGARIAISSDGRGYLRSIWVLSNLP
jgi:Tol biopolymer transport system component